LTTSRTLFSIKVKGQSRMVLCVSCVHDTAGIIWRGFTKCRFLDNATLLLPAEATAATCGLYLALSKFWRSCYRCICSVS